MIDIRFATKTASALRGAEIVAVVAPKAALDKGWHRSALGTSWARSLNPVIEDIKPGDNGASGGTYGGKNAPRRLVACVLPDKVSRHNAPSRSEAMVSTLPSAGLAGKKAVAVVYVESADHVLAATIAVFRAFPVYTRKSSDSKKRSKKTPGTLTLVFALPNGKSIAAGKTAKSAGHAVQLAARLVDTPPDDMTTAHFEKEVRKAFRGTRGVKVSSIVGNALKQKRMGGIWGVGRAAVVPPRLVIMDYNPRKRGGKTVCLVGKGIVYDTGGLNIKVGAGMSGMKMDMGGAAAVFGAFQTLVECGVKHRVIALCCMAENAVDQKAHRPDDILNMHSGKTVEINNTDAEGRLVLADGVSYAARDLKADLVIDTATLTGAQLIATGRIISASISNREGLEQLAVECGRATGDLTHPLPFAPEFFHKEFKSKVADMKNSVADRMNGQTSAAGQFVYNHIEELDVPWLHIDIAGPAFRGGRGSGHGAALIAEIVRNFTTADLKS